jgi:hypothetical protein
MLLRAILMLEITDLALSNRVQVKLFGSRILSIE